ncbi:hypothetical protein SLS61_005131 [Didymella pomorum]
MFPPLEHANAPETSQPEASGRFLQLIKEDAQNDKTQVTLKPMSAEAFDQMLSMSDTGSHKSTISVLVSSRDAAEADITNKNNQLADTQNKLDDTSYELEVE